MDCCIIPCILFYLVEKCCVIECPGLREDEFLDSLNIDNFANCTKVKGRLRILDHTFLGYVICSISLANCFE